MLKDGEEEEEDLEEGISTSSEARKRTNPGGAQESTSSDGITEDPGQFFSEFSSWRSEQ